MTGTQIKIPRSVVQKYLEAKEGRSVKILEYEKLGSGWHGTGYKVKFKINSSKSNIKEVVIRTLMPANFSHDWVSDRAKVFVLQHELAHMIPDHIDSFDVSGYTSKNELVSLGDVKEFFQIVEVARGVSYSQDFQRILGTGKLADGDLEKAVALSDYLVKLHSRKFKGSSDEVRSVRRRHTRDALGHGEMMIGVIDTYPDDFTFITKDKLTDLICSAAKFREKIKDIPVVPCRMHGDFHPGNILFEGKKLTLLDASREVYGDPADDVTTLAINYIWFAVMQSGGFDGPFAKLFTAFWNNYFKKTRDRNIARTAGIFFAFRGVVVAHPVFYSMQSDGVRRKMIRFVNNVLKDSSFDPKKIKKYLIS
jgi:aminoglycoside phosphotransferase family enzyme